MKQTLWKEYLAFSRQERVSILVILFLTGICIATPAAWEHYFPTIIEDIALPVPEETDDVKEVEYSLFTFDPNTLSVAGWEKLGVPPKNISTIQHYLAKGGRFRKKEDLQRIYGFPSAMYTRLAPYIQITVKGKDTVWKQNLQITERKVWEKRVPVRKVIEINEADSAVWESLYGIGPVLAARIVRFREKLGGFYSIDQLREVYGLADSTFVNIQPSLQMNKVSLKFLDINQLDEKSLAQHPYIRHKLARLIVLYRSNHGPFSNADALLGIPLVDDSIYRKIEPYIKTIK